MAASKPDHYSILGVFRDATQEEIKRAYFEAAQRLHPDKNVAAGETELFLDIQQAYEVLSNPKRRSQYDATLPPEIEEVNRFIRHEILYSRPSLVRVGEDQLIYVLLEIGPREEQSTELPTPPLNICLVLDRSTSMQGEKMDILKATAIQLLRSLRPQDVLSVVAFSDRAEVIVPASISLDKKRQEASIQMMQPSGGTEIYYGLEAGMREIRRTIDPSRVNHLILLTDGNTYGDEQACLQLAEDAASQNVGITGMGIGNEWNDIFLDALASKTGGTSAYISKPKDIERFLVDKFKTLVNIYADEVLLEYQAQENVRVNYAFRLQPEGGHIEIAMPLRFGPILRDTPLHVMLEIVVGAQTLTGDDVLLLNGNLKASINSQTLPIPPIRLRLTRNVEETPSIEGPPTRILKALSRLTLYRMQERAQTAVNDGQYEAASRHLQNLATHLLSQGENSLAKTALLESENLERMHSWTATGSKDIKYSTRALLLGSGKEKK
ncbi:MAG TPA: DnaJ domain-containing protein [Anaerolineales bacterium]|nr:DnaJ domain-containing protein [Anaerolineales bacterium]HNB35951.1 DnaJ domain-containing protein [Anaerolineales bacterium]HNC08182.1 DnaJ domain-containing protein [Anaerolineales bacterium]